MIKNIDNKIRMIKNIDKNQNDKNIDKKIRMIKNIDKKNQNLKYQ